MSLSAYNPYQFKNNIKSDIQYRVSILVSYSEEKRQHVLVHELSLPMTIPFMTQSSQLNLFLGHGDWMTNQSAAV